jgi:hypothetical protein
MHLSPQSTVRRVLLPLIWFSWLSISQAAEIGTEVTLWMESGLAVASSQLSGRRELPLGSQEIVISSGANGINGIVVTSRRLLVFQAVP